MAVPGRAGRLPRHYCHHRCRGQVHGPLRCLPVRLQVPVPRGQQMRAEARAQVGGGGVPDGVPGDGMGGGGVPDGVPGETPGPKIEEVD